MLRRLVPAVLAIAVGLGSLLAVSGAASARVEPSVTMLTLTPNINLGTHPKFQYSTSSLPANSQVQLQRKLSATSWKVVATPPAGTNLTVVAPAPSPIGEYLYRMQVINAGLPVAQTGHDHPVFIYDNITVQSMCPATGGSRKCVQVKTTLGGVVYKTHIAIGSAVFPNYFAGAFLARTSCRSAALIFTNAHPTTSKTWLKLNQPGHPDIVAGTARNTLGRLTGRLFGGRVNFDGSTELTTNSVYVDGTLLCWTPTGSY